MKRGMVSSNAENIPERLGTGVGGSDNTQAPSAALTQRWTCVKAKCNTGNYIPYNDTLEVRRYAGSPQIVGLKRMSCR